MDKNLDDKDSVQVKKEFTTFNTNNMPDGGIESYMSGTYLGKAKKNPELYRWLQEKAEQRNAETLTSSTLRKSEGLTESFAFLNPLAGCKSPA